MNEKRKLLRFAALFAAGLVFPLAGAAAQDAPESSAEAQLDGGEVHGVAAVNMTAGNANQQVNAGIVAMGKTGWGGAVVSQAIVSPGNEDTASAFSGIADGAFANSDGWIAANISAGSANQQANVNLMAIGLGGQVASAALLSQIRGPTAPHEETGDSSPHDATIRIGDGAFAGSSGLVQLSLVAGDRNSGANIFAMTVAEPVN